MLKFLILRISIIIIIHFLMSLAAGSKESRMRIKVTPALAAPVFNSAD